MPGDNGLPDSQIGADISHIRPVNLIVLTILCWVTDAYQLALHSSVGGVCHPLCATWSTCLGAGRRLRAELPQLVYLYGILFLPFVSVYFVAYFASACGLERSHRDLFAVDLDFA